MLSHQLTDQITSFIANNTKTKKFEALWNIPQGVSYNCYLINDNKTALIDTVEKQFAQEFLQKLKSQLKNKQLNYLVVNHMEPDHSGSILALIKEYPDLKIIGNHKTLGFLKGFFDIAETKVLDIKNKQNLNLGKHQLQFIPIPMAHWPESMITYETNQQILFSNDLLAGFKTIDDSPLASQVNNIDEYIDQARTYFVSVLGPVIRPAQKAIKQVKKLDIKTVAPAHGLIWQKNPKKILKLYKKWAEMQSEKGVVIAVGSMYSHTLEAAKKLQQELKKLKIEAHILNVAHTSLAEQLNLIWKYQGLVIGSCTYNNGLFPPIKYLIDALLERKLKNHILGIFSTYSWTGGAIRFLTQFTQDSQLELVAPQFKTQYKADDETLKSIKLLAKNLHQKLT